MKYGVDYGVKVDWEVYPKFTRILCRIPILNLFFTEKFDVHMTAMTPEGRPVYGTFGTLRFPRSRRLGAYNVICRLPSKGLRLTVKIGKIYSHIFHTNSDSPIGSTMHPIRDGDELYWNKYYIRKDSYKTRINLDSFLKEKESGFTCVHSKEGLCTGGFTKNVVKCDGRERCECFDSGCSELECWY